MIKFLLSTSNFIYKTVVLFYLLCPTFLLAQQSGKITYKQTVQTNFTPPLGIPKELANRIPKERTMVKELYFNKTESIYKNGKNERAEEGEFGGNDRGTRFRMRMRMGGGGINYESYKNLAESIAVDKNDLFGKEFLITDEIIKQSWKMTGNKKQILDYMAMESTITIRDTISVTAWFTPQIPVQNGPSIFGGLPGMILEVNQNDGKNIIIAESIELGEIDPGMIKKPIKGKKVDREEFHKIRKEKMEEMREQRGGGRFGFRRGG